MSDALGIGNPSPGRLTPKPVNWHAYWLRYIGKWLGLSS